MSAIFGFFYSPGTTCLARRLVTGLLGGALAAALGLSPTSAAAWLGACGAPATPVHSIQGAGRSSPLLGQERVVEAVVAGAFAGFPEGLGGFFVQEEVADADPATSEGLFVFDGGLGAGLAAGDRVRVRGRVREFFGRTELSGVGELRRCPGRGRVPPTRVRLPVADPAEWERWEGMRVRIEQRLVATDHWNLARFGEVVLAAGGRLWQPTHRRAPGSPALALGARNERRRILLDDGSRAVDPDPTPYLDRPDGGTLRLGDGIVRLEGIVDFAFGRYRIHPTRGVRFLPGSRRPETPPRVAGTLRLVAWNLANHFNGDGRGGGFPTRGARSLEELERQRAKLVETLVRLAPDVAALVELENDGVGPESALGQLARALTRRTPEDPYAVVDPGAPPPGRLGDHAIAVGILYRPSAAAPVGAPAILDGRAHPGFDDARNRPSLAQTFEARATGERFTLVANHWKSKGSDCDAAGDPDLGDGQGDCNGTRRGAARALLEWLEGDPTGAGDVPVLVAGDLNAYPKEDPVRTLASGGFVDLLAWLGGPGAHTFVFDGAAGRLDHLLARADLLPRVGGAAVWHANADEPRIFDHRLDNPSERFAPDPFRASDHDPLLVGLFPEPGAARRAGGRRPGRLLRRGHHLDGVGDGARLHVPAHVRRDRQAVSRLEGLERDALALLPDQRRVPHQVGEPALGLVHGHRLLVGIHRHHRCRLHPEVLPALLRRRPGGGGNAFAGPRALRRAERAGCGQDERRQDGQGEWGEQGAKNRLRTDLHGLVSSLGSRWNARRVPGICRAAGSPSLRFGGTRGLRSRFLRTRTPRARPEQRDRCVAHALFSPAESPRSPAAARPATRGRSR